MSKQIIETLKKGLSNKNLTDAQRKSVQAKIEALEEVEKKSESSNKPNESKSNSVIETLKKGLSNKHLSDAQRKSVQDKIEALEKAESKSEEKKEVEQPKAKKQVVAEPKPKYKVGDVLIHNDGFKDHKIKIDAVTGWTGDGHRYDIEFLDENLKPMNKFAKSYDNQLSKSKTPKKEKVVKQPKAEKDVEDEKPFDNDEYCRELIAQETEKKAKRKEAAEKRKDAPKKKEATKIKEGIERLEDKVEEKVSKGKITKAEIIKLIDNTKALLKSLEKQLKEFGTKKMAEGGNVEGGYKIFVGHDHRKNHELYQVVGIDNDYVGEWHKDKKDAEDELKDLDGISDSVSKFAEGGNVGNGDKFTYMMLSRLQMDNDYYLGMGNRSARNLWAGSVDEQIKEMKRLWNSLPEDRKPEWLSMEDIKEYEKEMTSDKYAKGGSIKRTKRAIEADKNLRAMPKGERVSHPFAIIRKANGETFKRRNANQFGRVEGDEVYREYRVEHTDKDQKKRFAEGGNVSAINWQNFTLNELSDYIKNEYSSDIQLNTFSPLKEVRTNSGTEFKQDDFISIGKISKKDKDESLSIGYAKQIEATSGSENVYLNIVVYRNDSDKPFMLSIYTKEDKKGIKELASEIIEKFAKGGNVGDLKVGDIFEGTPSATYEENWQLHKPSISYIIDNKTNRIVSIHNSPHEAIKEKNKLNPNFKLHFKVYPKEHYQTKMAKGGSIKRTKNAIDADKNLRAMPKGERVSHPFAIIRKANGETFKRRNANQFGEVEGDGVYTENRANRTDKDQKKRF